MCRAGRPRDWRSSVVECPGAPGNSRPRWAAVEGRLSRAQSCDRTGHFLASPDEYDFAVDHFFPQGLTIISTILKDRIHYCVNWLATTHSSLLQVHAGEVVVTLLDLYVGILYLCSAYSYYA